ncbi:MAG: 50S ribosomal protein L23 [Candidatus Saccharimonadales bacterium]
MDALILKPRLSEKSYELSQVRNTYVFDVIGDANKHTVAQAVAKEYDVEVTKVNVANISGKNKRTFLNRRGKFVKGQRSDIKKAYVTLKEGDKLPIFAQEEEAEAKAEKVAEKAAKKAAKEKK